MLNEVGTLRIGKILIFLGGISPMKIESPISVFILYSCSFVKTSYFMKASIISDRAKGSGEIYLIFGSDSQFLVFTFNVLETRLGANGFSDFLDYLIA